VQIATDSSSQKKGGDAGSGDADQSEQTMTEERIAAADDDESDVEANDGDAAATKELSRHQDTQDYEGEEEEKHEVGEGEDDMLEGEHMDFIVHSLID
jgi:hypothetical protein